MLLYQSNRTLFFLTIKYLIMKLGEFIEKQEATTNVVNSIGSSKRFNFKYKKLVKRINTGISTEKGLVMSVKDIKKLPPETEFTSIEVTEAYKEFSEFLKKSVNNLIEQD